MKIILYFLLAFSLLQSRLLDFTVASVDNEIITSVDVSKQASLLNITKKQALEVLIDEKIQKMQIQKLGLGVGEEELAVNAQKLGLDTPAKIEALRAKINEQRFFTFILDNARINADPAILRNFYEQNKDFFKSFQTIDLTLFTSTNKDEIKKVKKRLSYKSNELIRKPLKLRADDLNPQLLRLLNLTKVGTFTKTFANSDGFLCYYIRSKNGVVLLNFEQVEPRVKEAFMAKQERLYLQNYLDKLKASSKIIIFDGPLK